jgi:signal transduction histidine kinase
MDQVSIPRQEVLGAITDRQVAGLRLFLSITALIAIYLDPSEPDRFVPLTYSALVMYALYSAVIYCTARYAGTFSRTFTVLLVWADLTLYSVLLSLSSGTNSIFFLFYFFVILVACSRLGANTGVAVTFTATAVFFLLAWFTEPAEVQWKRLLLRPASLVSVGYVLTYWARAEHGLRQRLELLRKVSLTSNPRFGVDRTASHLARRVLEFFKADACVLLEYDGEPTRCVLRLATMEDLVVRTETLAPPEQLGKALQDAGRAGAALYTQRRRLWTRVPAYVVWDPVTQAAEGRPPQQASSVAEWLGCRSFIVVPLHHHEWLRGYMFVGARRPAAFRMEDARFLLQLAGQVTPVIEHIRLVDRMASGAAEEERRRIARSVHDRIIQPYIGLHMGLRGLRQMMRSVLKSESGESSPGANQLAMRTLDDLVDMARESIDELREYVYDLRKSGGRGDVLLNSLLRYAAKYEAVTGIRVTVVNRLDHGNLNDRLAGEIFQMAAEALSNVHRHTVATAVQLTVEPGPNGSVAVRIANETHAGEAVVNFVPRSIAERAESLGGHTEVTCADGRTVVSIEIPL